MNRKQIRKRYRDAVYLHEKFASKCNSFVMPNISKEVLDSIAANHYCIRAAEKRGWVDAAASLLREHESLVERMEADVADLLRVVRERMKRNISASVSDLYHDLVSLDVEFDELSLDRGNNTLAVRTEPIELQGEETFTRVFGQANWAVMFILACGGDSCARLRFNVGPQADIELPGDIDFKIPFAGSDAESWQDEYLFNVRT